MPEPRPSRERVASHTDRQQRRGLVRIHVWVPAEDAERLRNIAAQLRADAGAPLPGDSQPRPRAIQVPAAVEPRHPAPRIVWLEVGRDEVLLQTLLKANGGTWHGHKKLWGVPSTVVDQLDLSGRVRGPR